VFKNVKELILDSSTLMVLGGIVALLFLVGLACICNFERPESEE
jgi:Na+-transporting methylmalonyl-CoA/oxaloacetate decarboxylase gamma subunit